MDPPTETAHLLTLQQRVAALEQRQRELSSLLEATQVVTSSLELDAILQAIARQASRISGADGVLLLLLDDDAQVLRCRVAVGLPPEEIETLAIPVAESFSGQVAATGQPLNVPDIRDDPRLFQPRIAAKYQHVSYLGLPIALEGRLFGVLAFSTPAPRVYSAEEVGLLSAFARQSAIAIENARLHTTALRRTAELEALLRATRSLMSGLDLHAILDRLVVEASRITGCPNVKMLLVDREAGVLRAMAIHGQTAMTLGFELPLGVGRSGIVATTGQPLYSDDSANDPRNALFAETDRALGIQTYLGLPIKIRDEVVGVLTFNTTEPHRYAPEELAYLTSFADQAALAIENAGFFEATRRALVEKVGAEAALRARTRQLEAVRAVTIEITRELDLTTLLSLITRRAIELVGSDAGTVYLWDEEGKVLLPRAWHGYEAWRGAERLKLGEGVAGTVAERREGLIVNDYRTSRYAVPLFLERTEIASVLAEPLLYQDRLLGVLGISNHRTSPSFTPEDRDLLSLFAAQAAIAIENARLYADLERTYRDLQHAQEGLIRSAKLRALGQMAAGIAHDLNNMLAAILGQVELLRLRVSDPAVQASLKTLQTAATDGASVVRRLQDFARQRAASPLTPVALPPILTEALDITRPRWEDEAQRRGVVIQVVTDLAECPPILAYAPEVREALTNLILNAVDAMPEGGTLTIGAHEEHTGEGPSADSPIAPLLPAGRDGPGEHVTLRPIDPSAARQAGDGWVELTVTDTGVGMSEEIRLRMFEPFFTTKGLRGTGLGLSVVYGIVERHGGRIRVRSAPGHGTTVAIRFRAAQSEPADQAAVATSRADGLRLLLIDDDPSVRETLAALLRAAGHTVTEAQGGAAGLALLETGPVDCVITDLGMREVTGWDVTRAVKARYPSLPVLLLTGWGEHVTPDPASPAAPDRILGKPLPMQELLQALADVTGRG
jgi:signal transduction histidine kinase